MKASLGVEVLCQAASSEVGMLKLFRPRDRMASDKSALMSTASSIAESLSRSEKGGALSMESCEDGREYKF